MINYSALYEAGRDEGLAKIEELRAAYAPGSTNAEHQHENEKMYQASKEILGEKLPKMRDMVELLKKNRRFHILTFRVSS